MVPDVWNSAPQIWRWRDWIVDSSNQDLGYGPMVERMLAADEIAPADPQSAVATGYLIRNWYALNPNDWMRANVEHTARAFLGLSLQCAHCHDHKYDPLTQDDYFAFRAIFEPIGIRQDPIPGGEDPGAFQEYDYSVLRRVERRGMVSIFDRSLDAPTWRYSGGDERNRDEARGPIAPALPVFLAPSTPSISAVELPVGAWYPGLNPVHARASLEAADRKIASQRRHLEQLETREQELREAVARQAETRAKLERLIVESRFANPSFAIRGERSLWIDAREGRRILQRSLAELTQLVDGTEIEFRVRLLTDRHFNMQLAKDAAQGLTAGYVGFDGGRIVAYRPGGFDEFEIGRYDFAAGETEFLVRWRLFPSRNAAQLEVSDPAEEHQFASAEVAINDWNPIDDPNRPLTFDIRNGQLVLLDDLVVRLGQTADVAALGDVLYRLRLAPEGGSLSRRAVQDHFAARAGKTTPTGPMSLPGAGPADKELALQRYECLAALHLLKSGRTAEARRRLSACERPELRAVRNRLLLFSRLPSPLRLVLQAHRDVDRIADDREVEAVLRADRPSHHLAAGEPDADREERRPGGRPRGVERRQPRRHAERAAQRRRRRLLLRRPVRGLSLIHI